MRKKGGHHGGSWKVAYADFVTAMMALFLVLWLTSQDQKIKKAIERAFRNPFSSITKQSVGLMPNKDLYAVKNTTGSFDSASAIELTMLRRLNDDLSKSLSNFLDNPPNGSVALDVRPEGLRINLFDHADKPIFKKRSAEFTTYGEWVVTTLAWTISRHHGFGVEVEGHTPRASDPSEPGPDRWEISTLRANSARRGLVENGVGSSQIFKVVGYADTQPREGVAPEDESNRRITILLKLGHSKG